MVEALGIGLPGNAAIPAVDARRNVLARMAGRRIVEHGARGPAAVADPHPRGVRERDPRQRRDRRLDQRGDPPARDRRPHRRRARRSTTGTGSAASVPCLVNLSRRASYLMEDFYYAGGLPVVMKELASTTAAPRRAHRQRPDDRREHRATREYCNRDVIQPFDDAVQGEGRHRGAARQPRAATAR